MEALAKTAVPVRDCIGCNGCARKGQCVFADDMVNEIISKAKEADGFVFGSPVYYRGGKGHDGGVPAQVIKRITRVSP